LRIGEAVRLRILELCKEREITVNRLSMICGVTQSTLANITGGRNQSTTIATLKKICDGLEISIREFFESPLFQNLEQEIV
jgi:transcriptional regulator with XRE-family HTH domain